MKIIDHEIVRLYFITLMITIAILLGSYFFVGYLLQDNVKSTVLHDGLMVELNPNINRQFNSLTDYEGLNSKKNIINITNTAEDAYYEILISPLNQDDSNIRLSINDLSIKYLSDLPRDGMAYVIKKDSLPRGYTSINFVKLWLKYDNYQAKKYNFKLSVKKVSNL